MNDEILYCYVLCNKFKPFAAHTFQSSFFVCMPAYKHRIQFGHPHANQMTEMKKRNPTKLMAFQMYGDKIEHPKRYNKLFVREKVTGLNVRSARALSFMQYTIHHKRAQIQHAMLLCNGNKTEPLNTLYILNLSSRVVSYAAPRTVCERVCVCTRGTRANVHLRFEIVQKVVVWCVHRRPRQRPHKTISQNVTNRKNTRKFLFHSNRNKDRKSFSFLNLLFFTFFAFRCCFTSFDIT